MLNVGLLRAKSKEQRGKRYRKFRIMQLKFGIGDLIFVIQHIKFLVGERKEMVVYDKISTIYFYYQKKQNGICGCMR